MMKKLFIIIFLFLNIWLIGCDISYDERVQIESLTPERNLQDFVIDNDVLISYIGNAKTVKIPDNIEYIGRDAFEDCIIEEIIIPSTVKKIELYSFNGLYELKSITVDEKNEWYKSVDGVLYDKHMTNLILYPSKKQNNKFIVPDTVKEIGENAFKGNFYIKNITIPDNVERIGSLAFSACISLESIILPENLSLIERAVFCFCPSLKEIVIPESVTAIEEQAFANCESLTDLALPKDLKYIGTEAFFECYNLKELNFPDTLTSIGFRTFYKCDMLTKAVLSDNVTDIGAYAFYACRNLKEAVIPVGAKIGESAFLDTPYARSMLEEFVIEDGVLEKYNGSGGYVVIPEGVERIAPNALSNCMIRGLIIPSTLKNDLNQPDSQTVIQDNENIEYYHVAEGNEYYCDIDGVLFTNDKRFLAAYLAARGGEYVIPNGTLFIYYYAFRNCKTLKSVTIPDSVIGIFNSAFVNCPALYDINIKDMDNIEAIFPDSFVDVPGVSEKLFEYMNRYNE